MDEAEINTRVREWDQIHHPCNFMGCEEEQRGAAVGTHTVLPAAGFLTPRASLMNKRHLFTFGVIHSEASSLTFDPDNQDMKQQDQLP